MLRVETCIYKDCWANHTTEIPVYIWSLLASNVYMSKRAANARAWKAVWKYCLLRFMMYRKVISLSFERVSRMIMFSLKHQRDRGQMMNFGAVFLDMRDIHRTSIFSIVRQGKSLQISHWRILFWSSIPSSELITYLDEGLVRVSDIRLHPISWMLDHSLSSWSLELSKEDPIFCFVDDMRVRTWSFHITFSK